MNPCKALIGVTFLAVAILVCWIMRSTREADAAISETLPVFVHLTPTHTGTLSCSGVACHGSAQARRGEAILGNEHTIWLHEDRHARAYQTLLGERAQAITARLEEGPAHQSVRCLACHVTPSLAETTTSGNWFHEGVGCESCHGGASNWLVGHTAKNWRGLDVAAKQSKGMIPLAIVTNLTAVCVGCHVGSPREDGLPLREVNHDMIAAGHPRLQFEFTSYLTALLPHWGDAVTKRHSDPIFQAEAWAVGQLASARTALTVLDWQAKQAMTNPDTSWPDFAGYDCAGCHHDLQGGTRGLAVKKQRLGALVWGSWCFPLAHRGDAEVYDLMDEMNRKLPNPVIVARLVKKSNRVMDQRWQQVLAGKSVSVAGQLKVWLRQHQGPIAEADWDGAAQVYLAWRALKRPDDPASKKAALESLRRMLAFPVGFDSPRSFRGDAGAEDVFEQALRELGGE